MPMKFAADSSEPTTPVTKSTNGSVAMRMSSAILYSGFFAVGVDGPPNGIAVPE
jgi:hypothetical protein